MEDDDDAFLYGDDSAQTAPSTVKVEPVSASDSQVTGVAAADGESNGNGVAQAADEHGSDSEEGEESEDDDEDSESDIEFIIDAAQEGQQPPARPAYQRPGVPAQSQGTPQRTQSTITSEYTPLSRAQLLPSANPALAQAVNAVVAEPGAPSIKTEATQQVAGREGGPPAVPSTAPRLNLSPGPEDRVFPKPEDTVEEEEVQGQDIFDIDIDALTDKPWRRYGADLTDYFNYGFNEESWNIWRGKKERMVDARKQAESQMFGNPMLPGNMQQMMAMMPPPQQMQAMMAQQGAGMGMMPPEQMMAMMAGMGGMPPMGGRPINPAMAPGIFGAQRINGMGGFSADQQPPYHSQSQQLTPMHQQRGQSEAPSENGRDTTPRPSQQSHDTKQEPKDEQDSSSQTVDKPLGPPPMNLPMKPMSEADMSAFFGASGVDMSQVAAAGLNVAADASPSTASAGEKPSDSPAPSAEAPVKGASIRGRAAAVAGTKGPGAASPTLPSNVPSGPKNPGKRYNDRDTGSGGGDALDYGAHSGGGDEGRDHRGRDRDEGRDRNDGRSRAWDDDVDSRDRNRDRNSRDGSGWDSASHRDDRYARHRNDDRTPRSRNKDGHYDSQDRGGGWEDGESSGRRGPSSRSRRGDDYDDETASQSSAGGRHRRAAVPSSSSRDYRDDRSHRSDRTRDYRDRGAPPSSRDTDRDRERERDRDRDRDREREARNQLRAERRAGKDIDDPASTTSSTGLSIKGSRKRAAPEEPEDPPSTDHKNSSARRPSSSSRKKR